jgi:hypothetical protein
MVLSSGYVRYSTKVEFLNFSPSFYYVEKMESPFFYIHVELYSSKTGVHISAFYKALLQLKLHRACDFFSVYSTNYLAGVVIPEFLLGWF